jgi:hypothetical protein
MTNSIAESHASSDSVNVDRRIVTVAWLAGLSAFFGFTKIGTIVSLGAGIAFVGVAAMVTLVCWMILQKR